VKSEIGYRYYFTDFVLSISGLETFLPLKMNNTLKLATTTSFSILSNLHFEMP
jgi:hypothetical protein